MGQGINTCVCRGSGGQAQGQAVIYQSRRGHKTNANTEHFFVVGLVGNNGHLGAFRAGACSGGNGNNRQPGFIDHSGKFIVTHDAAVFAQNGNGFGTVDGAATANGNNAVVVAISHFIHTFLNRANGRLWHSIIKDI